MTLLAPVRRPRRPRRLDRRPLLQAAAALAAAVVLALAVPSGAAQPAAAAADPVITATYDGSSARADGTPVPSVVIQGTGFLPSTSSQKLVVVRDLTRSAPGFSSWWNHDLTPTVAASVCVGSGPTRRCRFYQDGQMRPYRQFLDAGYGLVPACGDRLAVRVQDESAGFVFSNEVLLTVQCTVWQLP